MAAMMFIYVLNVDNFNEIDTKFYKHVKTYSNMSHSLIHLVVSLMHI